MYTLIHITLLIIVTMYVYTLYCADDTPYNHLTLNLLYHFLHCVCLQEGNTAMSRARTKGHNEIVKLLEQYRT